MLSERAIQIHKDMYLCLIDYANDFEKVRHKETAGTVLPPLIYSGKILG